MRVLNFYTTKYKVELTNVAVPLEVFISMLQEFKPTELYHRYYSHKKPAYYITEYLEDGIMYYGDSFGNKTPIKILYKDFYRELVVQDITLITFGPEIKEKS